MRGEHFLIFVGIPFVGTVLGLLCHRIATSKGRSGWWALAGLGFHVGLIVVLALPAIRRARTHATRGPDEHDADAAPPTEGGATGGRSNAAKSIPRPAREWKSQLMRKPRMGWRSNDFLYLIELHFALSMGMMLLIGTIIATVGMYGILVGTPIRVNGVPTDSILVKLGFVAFSGGIAACAAAYIFYIRPGLIRNSNRDGRRHARRKRGVNPPPEE